jgi:hypothetical protein
MASVLRASLLQCAMKASHMVVAGEASSPCVIALVSRQYMVVVEIEQSSLVQQSSTQLPFTGARKQIGKS